MNKLTKLSVGIASIVSMSLLSAAPSFAESYNQGVATWPYKTDARCYQLFYKEASAANWQFSVHCKDLRNPAWQYTITHLKPGVSYVYKVRVIKNIANPDRYQWITNDMPLKTTPQK